MKTRVLGLLILCYLTGCSTAIERDPAAVVQMDPKVIANKLQSFTALGCPQFPYSIEYPNQEKWNLCCVQHNFSYWKGGTSDERLEADRQLRQCVTEQGDANAAGLVYLGARALDSEAFPTSAHWGYGWVLNHGYTPVSAAEKEQIDKLTPSDLRKVRVNLPVRSSIQMKDSLTKNFCLDGVVTFIQNQLRRTLTPMRTEYNQESSASGFTQTITIADQAFSKPYEFKFFMNKANACTTPPSQWERGTRIQLKTFTYPEY